MIGIDINVLVRWLTADEEITYKRAERLVAEAGDDGLYLGDTVLVELVWVLTRTYRFGRETALATLETLLDMREFVCADRGLCLEALCLAQANGCDFADALVAVRNREAGCVTTVTFDQKAARLPFMTLVEEFRS
ncbi:PIN domain-containing protein [Pelagibacterium lacus]|uniref:PIN domain-containing protein n=1 Tax=Pelagibacterium lacus TaxID=2282655 RepID=UPI001314BDE3|nr:type II toxin-antitoxin system VapC family toxin [Pelagibacterium lacus]